MLTFTSIQAVFVFNARHLRLVRGGSCWGVRIPVRVAEAGPEPESAAQAQAQEPGEGFFREVTAGYREILASRDLRLLIGLYCAQTVVAGASLVFTVSIALGLLDIGQSGLGYLNGDARRGRARRRLPRTRPRPARAGWRATSGSASSSGRCRSSWSPRGRPSGTGPSRVMVVLGLANSIVDVNAFTILQRIAGPQETMARVFGAMESAVIGGDGSRRAASCRC